MRSFGSGRGAGRRAGAEGVNVDGVFEFDQGMDRQVGTEELSEDEEDEELEVDVEASSTNERDSSPETARSSGSSESIAPPSPDQTPESTPESMPIPETHPPAHKPTSIPNTIDENLPSTSHSHPIPTPIPSTNSLSPTRRAHSRTPSSRSTTSSVFNDSTEGIGPAYSPPSLVVGLPSSAGSSTGAGAGGGGGFSGSPVGGLWRKLRRGSTGVAMGGTEEVIRGGGAESEGATKSAKRRTGSFGLAVGGRVGLLGKGRRKSRGAVEDLGAVSS